MPKRPLQVLLLLLFTSGVAARADDGAQRLVLATYKLSNEASTATGFVVCSEQEDKRRCFVVTAHHVLAQMKGATCQLVSRARQQDGTYHRQEIAIPIRREGKTLWTKHAEHDLAVLPLPESVDVKSIPLECLANDQLLEKVHIGDGVWLAVFPERSEANSAGFPILRSGGIASFPITPVPAHPLLLVDTTSWTGDSGGPVAHHQLRTSAGDPIIVGVVRGMRNITETVRESKFIERKINYPLGITEVLQARLARDVVEKLIDEQQ